MQKLPNDLVIGRATTRTGLFQKGDDGSAPTIGQQFESVLLKQVVEAMMPDPKASVFGGGNAGSMWRSMFADSIAGAMAKSDPLSLAAALDPSSIQHKMESTS
ncbi:MAG: rod-binding protein [Hyphomicrobium sp.]